MAQVKRNACWVVAVCAVLAGLVVAAPASAASPWWHLYSNARPGSLPPGGEATIAVDAVNVGDASTSGAVTFSDTLPTGVSAQGVSFRAFPVGSGQFDLSGGGRCTISPGRVQCTYPEFFPALVPYEYLEMRIAVQVQAGASSGTGRLEVSGGGAPYASLAQPLRVDGAPTPFGVEGFTFTPEEEGGAVDVQAGSHPFQLTTSLAVNQVTDPAHPPALVKDLRFQLPPGLVGDASAIPQCSELEFAHIAQVGPNDCPGSTAIGVATVTIYEPAALHELLPRSVPVFNLTPARGEPARFGFEVLGTPVIMDTAVRNGRDYGVTVSVSNITQLASMLSTQVTFWSVPGDRRHDSARGWGCLLEGFWANSSQPCVPGEQSNLAPLLTLPTACAGPLTTGLEGDSWPTLADPAGLTFGPLQTQATDGLGRPVGMAGCDQLPFTPSISVSPETHAASTPTGLDVHVHLPQDVSSNGEGVAEAAIRDVTVALPAGMALNPAGAGGLEACSEGQVGFEGVGANGMSLFSAQSSSFCPDAAKIGTVKIDVPIVPDPVEGAVYVAAQNANPFGSLIAMYIVAEDPMSGIKLKLPGEVALDPQTGQLTTTFKDNPQAPVEDIELHFFGGGRGPLATPAACGAYTTSASFTPWSGAAPVSTSGSFDVTSGPNGAPCQSPAPFAPSLVAGTASPQAGAFSPFTAIFSRSDSDQALSGVSVRTPSGLLGILEGVERCGETQANQGSCGQGSLIGHTTVAAGAGPEPYVVQGGQVFLTGPYKGAPFGLSIVVPAVAGPFNLGNVVVRAAIHVDPRTAHITVTSDPLPTILQGIPLQVKKVNVTIDRPGFMFNPTNCEPLSVGGTLTSNQGASANVSSHFQAANCASLPFHPVFKVSTQAKTSKKSGASLTVRGIFPKGAQANIRGVGVVLPKQLPARLTTIQQACPEATFAANPASCPVGSNIGIATATTPVLASPLTGPAYLVSHGGAAFPDVVIVFQGEGVTLDLVGAVNIKHQITSSNFATVPDAPISSFQLTLPEGPHSGLAAVVPAKAKGNLCGQTLKMPFTITAQNGAVVKQNTKIAVTGCAKAKKKAKAKHKKPTRGAHGKHGKKK